MRGSPGQKAGDEPQVVWAEVEEVGGGAVLQSVQPRRRQEAEEAFFGLNLHPVRKMHGPGQRHGNHASRGVDLGRALLVADQATLPRDACQHPASSALNILRCMSVVTAAVWLGRDVHGGGVHIDRHDQF